MVKEQKSGPVYFSGMTELSGRMEHKNIIYEQLNHHTQDAENRNSLENGVSREQKETPCTSKMEYSMSSHDSWEKT